MRTPRPWVPPQRPTLSRDLRALGITNRKLSDEVSRGVVVQLRRGVYIAAAAVPAEPAALHLLRARAEQVAQPDLVACGPTAALAWQLPFLGDGTAADQPPVLAAARHGKKRSGSTTTARIRVTDLPPHHVVVGADGLELTSRVRTAVDVASGTMPQMLLTVDTALRAECQQIAGVTRRSDLANARLHTAGRDLLSEAAGLVRPRDAALAIAIARADPRRETVIESLSAGHMMMAGLPEPIPQAPVRTPMGTLYPDFLWPDHRLIGEADGRAKYETSEVMMREKEREQVLRDLGFEIVRWTGKEIWLTPGRVIGRIERALASSS